MGLGRATLHTFVSQGLKFAFSLLLGVLIARALGPEGRGEYGLLMLTFSLLVALGNLGLPASAVYFTAQNHYSRASLVKTLAAAALLLGLLGDFLLLLVTRLGWDRLLFGGSLSPAALGLALVGLPLLFSTTFFQAFLQGRHEIQAYNRFQLFSVFLQLALVAACFGLGGVSVNLLVGVFVLSQGISLLFLINALREEFRGGLRAPWLGLGELAHMGRYSLWAYLGNSAQFLCYRIDVFLVGAMLGTAAVGLYTLAVSLGEMLWMLTTPLATVLFPHFSASEAGGHRKAFLAAAFGLGSTTMAAALLFVVSPWLVVAFYGLPFAASVEALHWLLPGIVAFSATNVLAAHLAGTGKPKVNFYAALVALGVTVLLDFLLIPRWGIVGASVATSFAYASSSLVTLLAYGQVVGAWLRARSHRRVSVERS